MTEVVHKRIYANLWRADWSFLPVILMSTLCYWWLNLCILLSLLASTVKSAALQSYYVTEQVSHRSGERQGLAGLPLVFYMTDIRLDLFPTNMKAGNKHRLNAT
ncbi:hypothetical protein QVD17_27458 [Tagetes erecta]|uniref:Uncharacterized protein n=1 Tax=Tagetes erecta TaxID=13708 RepID=A0AAD8KEV3_TARER|nr:hypothetical protein QVD17_27458 [Tagetes erecta]